MNRALVYKVHSSSLLLQFKVTHSALPPPHITILGTKPFPHGSAAALPPDPYTLMESPSVLTKRMFQSCDCHVTLGSHLCLLSAI